MLIRNRYPSVLKIFLGHRYRHARVFGFILLLNGMAALLEGLSFTILLGALSVLSNDGTSIPFRSFIPDIGSFSKQTLCLSLIIGAILFQGFRTIITTIALYLNTQLSLAVQNNFQITIYERILNFSYRSVSEYKIGDLVEYTKTPAAIVNSFTDHLNRAIVSIFILVAILVVMFMLDAKLAITTVIFFIFAGIFQKKTINKIGRSSIQLSGEIVDCAKQTTQAFQSIRTIHSYHRQEYVLNKIRPLLAEIMRHSKKVYFWTNMIPGISELMGTFLVTVILFSGAFILSESQENILPLLITFLALTHRLAIRIQTATTCLGIVWSHKGSFARLEQILSDKDKEWVSEGTEIFRSFQSQIEFENVFLQYPSAQKPAIKGLSLTIPKGKVVAFVGLSGAGKSSILDLLLRLYDPTGGRIVVDGVDISKYQIGSWRKMLGVVSQDVSIFNDTIEENVCFGQVDASDEKVDQALRWAGLEEFINSLPEKKHTVVGERGFRLSGGQRQRIALARALVRNPEILILDEATSSLDSHSESLIKAALEELRLERTILIVAHRLSTVLNADLVYVVEDGQVVEAGNHSSLVKKGGTYARFWQLQQDNDEKLQPAFS